MENRRRKYENDNNCWLFTNNILIIIIATAKDLSHFCSEVLFLGADQKFGSDGTELNTKIGKQKIV